MKRKMRRKLQSIFSIFLCVLMIVPNVTTVYAYNEPSVAEDYTDNTEDSSEDYSSIIITNNFGNDGSEENLSEEDIYEEIESEETQSEEKSEIESEEQNSEDVSEEENSEKSSDEQNSEKTSEEKNSEKASEEKSSEEDSSEKTSEELDKEDTKKSNIEVTFDEGVTVIIKNDNNTVKIVKASDNIYIFNKDNDCVTAPYDDRYIINDFDMDEDVTVSLIANENYILTDYSISNDDETIIEESNVEKFEYETSLTTTENVYINIKTDIISNIDTSTLDDEQKYIYENINSEYVNKITKFDAFDMILLKSTTADKNKLNNESIDGLFSSDKQVEDAYLYQRTDAIGLYDVNKKSDYLVGKIDLLSNDDDFTLIDYVFTRSNVNGEVLDGAIFDTNTGLVYLPKSLVKYLDDGLVDVGSNQLQILYAFDDGTDNIKVKEIEDEEGNIEEVKVNMAAPKVFMRMAAPALLGAASSDPIPEYDIQYSGRITGDIEVGQTMTINLPYGYSTEDIGYGSGHIVNTNVLGSVDYSQSFVEKMNAGIISWDSLRKNMQACFPHRITVTQPETYEFDGGKATMTIYPGQYALECIHTNYTNRGSSSPMAITVTVLGKHINDDETGFVYLGLTCPKINTQSGAGVIKLEYKNKVIVREKKVGFKLQKVDDSGKHLGAGFKFAVLNAENNRLLKEITTNDEGIAECADIYIPWSSPNLRVKVREISCPPGYQKDNNYHEITATEDYQNEIQLTFINKRVPHIIVRKVDTKGNTLARPAYCQVIQVIDGKEHVKVPQFQVGLKDITVYLPAVDDDEYPVSYILRETVAPEGYIKAVDVPFTVTKQNLSKDIVVKMEDPFTTVQIEKRKKKVDNVTGEVTAGGYVAGAHLFLYKKLSNGRYVEIKNWITEASAFKLECLAPGNYRLEEHEAPEGYLNAAPINFTVEAIPDIQKIVMLEEESEISILKVDEKDVPLVGAELQLYNTTTKTVNGKIQYSRGSSIKKWISDGSPYVIKGLDTSKVYWLEENSAPAGYTKFEGHKLIQFGHKHTDACYERNTRPWPLVYATANDSESESEVWICAACGETLYHYWRDTWTPAFPGDSGYQEHCNPDASYRDSQVMCFKDLNSWYTNANHTKVSRTKDDTTYTTSVRSLFPSNGIFSVYKDLSLEQPNGTWETYVPGDEWGIGFDKNYWRLRWCNDEVVPAGGESGYYFKTTADAAAFYEDINVDAWKNTSDGYYCYKTGGGLQSLRGFHINCPGCTTATAKPSWDLNEHTTESGGKLICGFIESGNDYIIKVPNKQDGYGFCVAKVDSTGKLIPGATLSVYKVEDGKDIPIKTKFLSTKDYIQFDDVEPGEYKLVEDAAPVGYLIAKPITFQVSKSKPYRYIEMEDVETKIFIDKRLVSPSQNITQSWPGAHLQIIDPDTNTVIDNWWSQGYAREITGKLEVDKEYVLKEIKEISGTMNAGEVRFKVSNKNKITITSDTYNKEAYKLNNDKNTIIVDNLENYVEFIKQDNHGQLLDGAKLQLIRKSDNKVIETWISGQDGYDDNNRIAPHVIRGLAAGKYIWREVSSPPGYFEYENHVDQEIEITNTSRWFSYRKTNIATNVSFLKVDAKTGEALAGAELSLWRLDEYGNPHDFIEQWTTTDEKHTIYALPAGEYKIIELSAPKGYEYANSLIKDGQVNNNLIFTVTNTMGEQAITIEDPRIKGEFELLKVNGSNGEPITGDKATFKFLEYNSDTDTYEVSQHYWIDYVKDGLYSVFNDLPDVPDYYLEWTPLNNGKFAYREIKAPYNAEVDPNLQYINLKATEFGKSIVMSNDPEHSCPIHPANRVCDVCDPDAHKIFLGHNAKPDEGWEKYPIFSDPDLAEIYAGKVFANNCYKGGFELVKYDKDASDSNKTNTAQGDVLDLSGFEFKLYNRSGKAVYVYPKGDSSEKVKVENDGLISVYTCDSDGNILSTKAVSTLITNSEGYIGIPHQSLDSGIYELIETKAKEGYQLPTGDEKSITFTVAKDDEYFHFEYNKVTNADDIKSTNQYFADKIIRGDVQLTKYDKELNKSEVIGGSDHGNNTISAKLNNIQFEIINKSTNPVYVNNKWYNKDEVVTTITTHWNADKKAYTAETTGNLLPYGTYTIREKTAGEGYIKTDAIQNFEIRNNNEVVTVNTNGELLKLSNQIVRGDVQFKKVSNDTGRLIKAPFLITNVATKEKHIVVTNSQGLYSSGTAQHSNNTNGNDALLAKYEADPNYAPTKEELDDTAGIWFGQGENGSNAPVDDSLGALPYGDYVLQELRSHSNEGLELVTINFSVGKSNETDNPSIDLDIIYDMRSDYPGIRSSAVENTSITHVAKAGTTVTIVDRIDLWDLVSEENYKAVGYLIDKKTGNKIKYKGAEVTDEHSFVADGTTENFNLSFTFDTTGYEGSSVVVYVYLYKEGKLEDNDKTKEGVNINNISETVVIPTIHTSLEDEFTKDNVVVVYETAEKSKVIDTVSYKNLAINTATDYAETPDDITENQTYTIKGKLYDKTTNKVVATSEVTFTPTTVDGTVKVPYEFKGENGHTYVATEELYVNNVLVAEHNDLEDEAQTVYSPRGWTEAIDATTGTHAGVVGENQIIKDTVYYENLVIGKTYTIKGTLMDKETNTAVIQKGAPVTASTVFTASKTSGHVELEFVVDTTLFKDKAIVVFEDFYHKDINVYSHADINDENQTITYSDLKTTAIDANTTDNVAVAGTTTIKDKVQCSNLIVGKTYEIKGILMDKKTGEYLGKDLGLTTPISATKKFTAEAKDQVVEMVFTVDGSKLQGKTCVVFENLYLDDKLISTHEMIDDVDQTVYFPSVHTTAITDTGLKEQLADKGQLIYDKVELNNLVVGKEYTVTGKVYDKATKEAIKEGNDFITSSQTFTATDAHMIIELKFTIKDASKLNGKTMVVFEKLYHNNYEVATHEDINDFEQSVKYPNLETNACDIKTKLDEIPNDTVTISDEIDYSNLEKGATYTVKGTIYRKDTNKPMLFADGYVVGTTTFVAQADKATVIDKKFEYVQTLEDLNAALASSDKTTTELGETKSDQVVNGKVEVVFENINAKDLYGKTMVVFEYLYRDKILVGIHADINDDNQDIKTLDISTFAREKESGIQELICSKETHVIDTVSITNATENNTYTITSKIVDINTDEVIATFKNDYKITNKNYVETKDGYKIYNVDIEMTFDSTKLAGRSFVIYEYVQRDNETLALHEDKNDLKQRLYFPNIGTSAKDSETKDSDSLAEKDDVLIDTVKYENLTKGELYYVTGTLMDKETKKPVVIDGKEITSTTYFYAGENKPLDTIPTKTRDSVINSGEKVSGTIDVTFKFDSTSLAGKDVVVFEKAYTFDNIIIGEHEDIDDKDQTISYPKIGTTLLDKSTERHEGMAKSEAVYIDTVKYENLCVGKEYTVTGTLMDKSTGKPLTGKGATSTVTFTPTEANGEIEVKFVFDSSSLAGKVIVCFEDLYRNNHLVATHTDLEDENQSVSVTPPPGSPTKYVKVKIAKADKLRTYYMLKGAEITIFNGDGTIAKDIYGKDCVGVTDENGLVWFHLYQNPWDHYYAQETKAPKGYAICNDKFAIYATDDMSKDADNAYQINVNIFDMWLLIPPKTGDNLPILPICLMAFLFSSTFITGVILLRRKRKH